MKIIEKAERIQSTPEIFVVKLDGRKTKTVGRFYKKIAKRLRFPDYFGKNLDALDECLSDLEWIEQPNVLLYIKNPDDFLSDEEQELRDEIRDIFKSAKEEPIDEARSFDVIGVV